MKSKLNYINDVIKAISNNKKSLLQKGVVMLLILMSCLCYGVTYKNNSATTEYPLKQSENVYKDIAEAEDVIEHPSGVTQSSDLSNQNNSIPKNNDIIDANISDNKASIAEKENLQKININKASETELTTLKGIGPSKANSIIDYRNQNGAFASIEEIMKVPGIKQGTYDKIKDYITVED